MLNYCNLVYILECSEKSSAFSLNGWPVKSISCELSMAYYIKYYSTLLTICVPFLVQLTCDLCGWPGEGKVHLHCVVLNSWTVVNKLDPNTRHQWANCIIMCNCMKLTRCTTWWGAQHVKEVWSHCYQYWTVYFNQTIASLPNQAFQWYSWSCNWQ